VAVVIIGGKVNNPYKDEHDIRLFDVKANSDEYVWHRDHENRLIEVLEGDGWQFQPDGVLPFLLKPGMKFYIASNEYHRLIKGVNNLKVKITTLDK
jgi:hypothetical protein